MVVEGLLGRFTAVIVIATVSVLGVCVPHIHDNARATTSEISLSLSTPEAGVIRPGQDLVVTAQLTNSSALATADGRIALFLDRNPLTSVTALDEWMSAAGERANDLGTNIAHLPMPGVAANSDGPTIEFRIPAANLDIGSDGSPAVYGIAAQYLVDEAAVSHGRGAVIWDTGARSRVPFTVLAPLTAPPSGEGLISADYLEAYTTTDGVLEGQLKGIASHPNVTIGIDPMILASIRVLGSSAPRSAIEWLGNFTNAGNETFALSYADSDLAVQFQAGLTSPLQPEGFDYAIDEANFSRAPEVPTNTPDTSTPGEANSPETRVTASPSPVPPDTPTIPGTNELLAIPNALPRIAWPGNDSLTHETVTQLAENGYTRVILDSNNTEHDEIPPLGLSQLGSIQAIVANSGLTDAFRRAIAASSDNQWREAIATASAHLALMSDEPTASAFASLDRVTMSSAARIGTSIAHLNGLPWVAPTSLSAQRSMSDDSAVIRNLPEAPERIAATQELIRNEAALAQFATALETPDQLTQPERTSILALLANGWRRFPGEWPGAVGEHRAQTSNTMSAIHIAPSSDVTQVGVEASIPVTIANDLDFPAVGVLHVSPSNGRLHVQELIDVVVEPRARKTVRIPTTARIGNGEVTLSINLVSRAGVSIAQPSVVSVNVRADWEGIGAVIVAGLIVGFFGFGVFRTVRRRRRERAAAHPTDMD